MQLLADILNQVQQQILKRNKLNDKIDVDWLINETEKIVDKMKQKKWYGITLNAVKELIYVLIIKYYQENSQPKEEK